MFRPGRRLLRILLPWFYIKWFRVSDRSLIGFSPCSSMKVNRGSAVLGDVAKPQERLESLQSRFFLDMKFLSQVPECVARRLTSNTLSI